MCNIVHYNTYEGEAAMLLQAEAERYVKNNGWRALKYIFPSNTRHLLNMVVDGLKKQFSPGHIAALFLVGLVELIEGKARSAEAERIVFSGGVFQNSFLVNLIKRRLSGPFKLYFHKYLSPNDECISFGQLAYYYHVIHLNKMDLKTRNDLVLK
jgi:hydrogenase maturation protein HypF